MMAEDVETRAWLLPDPRPVGARAWLCRHTKGSLTRYLDPWADPHGRVAADGHAYEIRADQPSASAAEDLWPRAPTAPGDHYRRRADRVISLLRSVEQQAMAGWPPADHSTLESETWSPGMSCLRVGIGPPLLYLPGLTAHHGIPHGMDRAAATGAMRGLARGRQVWWVNRRAGLPQQVTMAQLAADYAAGIRAHFNRPIDVVGMSTGGSVALQLAADHPEFASDVVAFLNEDDRGGPRAKRGCSP